MKRDKNLERKRIFSTNTEIWLINYNGKLDHCIKKSVVLMKVHRASGKFGLFDITEFINHEAMQ